MWAGIPKDAGCREGWRDFLNFLNHDILVETGKVKFIRRQTPFQRLAAGQTPLVGRAT